MPDRTATGRDPLLILLALVVCCAGHALLVVVGAAGAAAAFAAVIGNWPAVAAGVVGLALAGTAVAIHLRRPRAPGSQHRTQSPWWAATISSVVVGRGVSGIPPRAGQDDVFA